MGGPEGTARVSRCSAARSLSIRHLKVLMCMVQSEIRSRLLEVTCELQKPGRDFSGRIGLYVEKKLLQFLLNYSIYEKKKKSTLRDESSSSSQPY